MTHDLPPIPSRRWLHRLPILLILATALGGAFLLRDTLSFDGLARHRAALLAYRDAHFLLASAGFVAAYALIVALSLPGATVATLAGGFLFGLFPGVVFNVVAATLGAVAVFLAARAGFGRDVAAGIAARGGAAARLQAGLQENQWSALLTMRLVPAVPFFLANLLPAFAGIGLWPFALTTVLGIIPAALIFTSIGSGLGEVFARGAVPDLSLFAQPHILWPLLGLGALAALPMIWRAFTRKGG
jgi:uncharacterized membrane protein YdjX (TVP38/TMEM64 family)